MREASARDGRSDYSPQPTHTCRSSARWLSAQWAGKEGGAGRGGLPRGESVAYDHTLAVAGVEDDASRRAGRRSVGLKPRPLALARRPWAEVGFLGRSVIIFII